MNEEVDIGLSNLARRSFSSRNTPSKRTILRPSTISISLTRDASGNSPLKSPSSPNLLKNIPSNQRRLSRSNTLPRSLPPVDGLDNLTMEAEKVTRLRRWIHALVIVDFDLEYGPKVTRVYPPLNLSPSEEQNIAFSSFPDSPQTEQGSQIHSFRLRQHHSSEDELLHPNDNDRPHTSDGFIYGFAHFTQRRDTTSKRGYQQRSLVILTPHAYPSLFYTLLSYLGQSFLMHGGPMLEVACHNMASWSDPIPGSTIELGFLGFVFTAELPSTADSPQSHSSTSITANEYEPDTHIIASLAPSHPPIVTIFEACIQHLWSIWECLVLCEPLLIYGPSAAMTSQAVWWLRDILRPIPLAGDFRPFFTIHDADHGALVNTRPPQGGLLLGVTNPLIARACKHWPHVVSLGAAPKREKYPQTPKTPRTPWTPWTPSVDTNSSAGPAPGWKTKTHKRYISRDKALLKKLEDAYRGDEKAKLQASNALRQHFSSRTTALLVPLQRYLNTLIPSPAESAAWTASHSHSNTPSPIITSAPSNLFSNPHHSTSSLSSHSSSNFNSLPNPNTSTTNIRRLKPFSTTAFLASLSSPSTPNLLPFKSSARQREFYEKWLRTRAFGVWLGVQEEVVKKVLEGRE